MKIRDITKIKPLGSATYRVAYRMRQWIGKPDPSGMGINVIDYSDPGAMHDRCVRLDRAGHKVIGFWAWNGKEWVRK